MPSAFTHAVAALSIGTLIVPGRARLLVLGAACAVVPDLDVLAFRLGIPYEDMLGHRGLSHSVAFAICLAAAATWLVMRLDGQGVPALRLGLFLFLATVSHGVLDALTDGGLGVAFFAPIDDTRYFFPWRPIVVSPISIRRFFSSQGLAVMASELVIVWIPAILVSGMALGLRRRRTKGGSSA